MKQFHLKKIHLFFIIVFFLVFLNTKLKAQAVITDTLYETTNHIDWLKTSNDYFGWFEWTPNGQTLHRGHEDNIENQILDPIYHNCNQFDGLYIYDDFIQMKLNDDVNTACNQGFVWEGQNNLVADPLNIGEVYAQHNHLLFNSQSELINLETDTKESLTFETEDYYYQATNIVDINDKYIYIKAGKHDKSNGSLLGEAIIKYTLQSQQTEEIFFSTNFLSFYNQSTDGYALAFLEHLQSNPESEKLYLYDGNQVIFITQQDINNSTASPYLGGVVYAANDSLFYWDNGNTKVLSNASASFAIEGCKLAWFAGFGENTALHFYDGVEHDSLFFDGYPEVENLNFLSDTSYLFSVTTLDLSKRYIVKGNHDLVSSWCEQDTSCAYQDSLVLVDFYHSTNGQNWTNQWDLTQPMSTWYGVKTNQEGCVTILDLQNNQLSGTLSVSLANLNSLENLLLGFNEVTGIIPKELGDLPNLCILLLQRNKLSGFIPKELGKLANLKALNLKENQLTDIIPKELSDLMKLEVLVLNDNQLTGSIPVEFGITTSLKTIYLNDNELSGEIPSEFGELINLEVLELGDNQLSGIIPSEFGKLINLKILRLDNNQLSGEIPPELGNLNKILIINFKDNELSGCFPAPLNVFCDASINYFSGNPNLPEGGDFDAFCNDGTGGCMEELTCRKRDSLALVALYNSTDGANWTTPWDLAMPINTWSGVTLNNTACVTRVILQNKNLVGSLPTELGNLEDLEQLILNANELSGTIPEELSNLNNLIILRLENNAFTGNIPPILGTLTNLETLYLGFNQLTGNLPPELSNLELLSDLRLHHNQLSGCFPAEYTIFCNIPLVSFGANSYLPGGGDFDAFCNDGTGGCDTGTGECQPNEQISGTLGTSTIYKTAATIESDAIISTGVDITFEAGQSITLQAGFYAQAGSNFTAKIANCEVQEVQSEHEEMSGYNLFETTESLVKEAMTLKIAPNPFNHQTKIAFYLPKGGFTHLAIRDITGQIVAPITATEKEQGWHQIQFNNTNLQSGIYYLSLYTADSILSKKIVLIN